MKSPLEFIFMWRYMVTRICWYWLCLVDQLMEVLVTLYCFVFAWEEFLTWMSLSYIRECVLLCDWYSCTCNVLWPCSFVSHAENAGLFCVWKLFIKNTGILDVELLMTVFEPLWFSVFTSYLLPNSGIFSVQSLGDLISFSVYQNLGIVWKCWVWFISSFLHFCFYFVFNMLERALVKVCKRILWIFNFFLSFNTDNLPPMCIYKIWNCSPINKFADFCLSKIDEDLLRNRQYSCGFD